LTLCSETVRCRSFPGLAADQCQVSSDSVLGAVRYSGSCQGCLPTFQHHMGSISAVGGLCWGEVPEAWSQEAAAAAVALITSGGVAAAGRDAAWVKAVKAAAAAGAAVTMHEKAASAADVVAHLRLQLLLFGDCLMAVTAEQPALYSKETAGAKMVPGTLRLRAVGRERRRALSDSLTRTCSPLMRSWQKRHRVWRDSSWHAQGEVNTRRGVERLLWQLTTK